MFCTIYFVEIYRGIQITRVYYNITKLFYVIDYKIEK